MDSSKNTQEEMKSSKKIILNRNSSIDVETYKGVLTLIKQNYSLSSIHEITDLDMKLLRNIRRYAVLNKFIPKKRNVNPSRLKSNQKDASLDLFTENFEDTLENTLEDSLENTLEDNVQNISQNISQDICKEEPKDEPKEQSKEQSKEPIRELTQTKRVLNINFKGILITVDISSITVKENIIIVR
jgi:hypothetical protein